MRKQWNHAWVGSDIGGYWQQRYRYNGKPACRTGRELHSNSGLLDYGFRYYDPSVGRFTGVDPLAEKAPNLTPYRYGFNNPISFIDPDGLFETRSEAKQYAKDNDVKTGLFRSNKIKKQEDGSYSIENKSDNSFISNDSEFGIMKGALISERGVHLRDIGLDGFNDLGNPFSESYNPNAVVFTDALDVAYAIGSYLGITSPTARVIKAAKPIIKFPGSNPGKAPKGFEWKGKPGSKPGSKDGNWYNSKTGESLRPDLNHPKPIGPHWDYKDPSGNWWRIFPDGTRVSK